VLLRLGNGWFVLCIALCVLPCVFAPSNINVTGWVDASTYFDNSAPLVNNITGSAGSATNAAIAFDLTCTNCIGGTEVNETNLSGTASSLTAGDISCSACLDTTDIMDVYLFNTGDTATGNYTFGDFMIDDANGRVGVNKTSPKETLHVQGPTHIGNFSAEIWFNGQIRQAREGCGGFRQRIMVLQRQTLLFK
jgi:hypothetical protein